MTTYIRKPGPFIKTTLTSGGNATADFISTEGAPASFIVKAAGACQVEAWSVDRDGTTLFDLFQGTPRVVSAGIDLLLPIDIAVRQLRIKVTDLSSASNAINMIVDQGSVS